MVEPAAVAITGATGFIGGALARHFCNHGSRVIALSRRPPQGLEHVEHRSYDLTRPPAPDLLAGVDCLVHAAFIAGDRRANVAGSAALLEASRRHGVSRLVFLSSLSARSDARSKYGQQKLDIERLFGEARGASLRLGLVLGDGGLFQRVSTHVKKRGLIPLVDGGMQPLQVVSVDEVVAAVDEALSRRLSGTFALAHPTPIAYRDFYTELCAIFGVRPRFVPLPSSLLLLVLGASERLGISLPVTSENVWGLKQARAIDTSRDLQALGVEVKPVLESLERLRALKRDLGSASA